jgi:CDP-glucose 4,6-dehydratase
LSLPTLQSELERAYRGRRVLVTGHTGFKGGWLAAWLADLGAEVAGYALPPPTEPNLFTAAGIGDRVRHAEGDVRDLDRFAAVWRAADPEVVFHLAAQPLVRESYRDPVGTLSTNVLGTAHALEIARRQPPRAMVVVTSDKCYENREWPWPYRESDALGGHDIYSASKAAAELITDSFRRSFFQNPFVPVATARAGNVIGGGDWAANRIVPDAVRALAAGEPVRVRNPRAVRPWQHVLEPLSGYLLLGARLLAVSEPGAPDLCSAWNFGPDPSSSGSVADLVETLIAAWGAGFWEADGGPSGGHEAGLLRLAIDKAAAGLGWAPRWGFPEAIRHTADWYRAFYGGEDMASWCRRQIHSYLETR